MNCTYYFTVIYIMIWERLFLLLIMWTAFQSFILRDNCVRGTRAQPLICVGGSVHYVVSCAINKGGFFEIAFVVVVDTHLPRFEALAYVLPHFDELTHVVIRASSAFIIQAFAEVFYSVFVKRSSFRSLLNLRKAYIFQEFAEALLSMCVGWIFQNVHLSKVSPPLCHKVNLPRCEARRCRFVMTCDIFGTGQTNILGLCYLFEKNL